MKGSIVDCYSEFLPVPGYQGRPNRKSPAMHFRVTVRDTKPTGGGVDHADVQLNIDPRTGPFLVTSQAAEGLRPPRRLPAGRDVAGQRHQVPGRERPDQAVDRRRQVMDEARKTTNDGSASVRIPRVRSSQARIMVEAVDNYFYAVNDRWFAIS